MSFSELRSPLLQVQMQRVTGARAVPLGRGEQVLGRVQLPLPLQGEIEGVLKRILLRFRHKLRVSTWINCFQTKCSHFMAFLKLYYCATG